MPLRAEQSAAFGPVREKLVDMALSELWEGPAAGQVMSVANEAEALAWITPYPVLMFPALFEEKLASALHRARRQEQVRAETREIILAV
jgi:hypothetical protein